MIAPQVLAISICLSVTWGIYLWYTITDYLHIRSRPHDFQRRRGDVVSSFRRMVVAFCLWMICFAYVVRTIIVLAGFGDVAAGQITFFALLGTNVVGSLFAVVSLRYD